MPVDFAKRQGTEPYMPQTSGEGVLDGFCKMQVRASCQEVLSFCGVPVEDCLYGIKQFGDFLDFVNLNSAVEILARQVIWPCRSVEDVELRNMW